MFFLRKLKAVAKLAFQKHNGGMERIEGIGDIAFMKIVLVVAEVRLRKNNPDLVSFLKILFDPFVGFCIRDGFKRIIP